MRGHMCVIFVFGLKLILKAWNIYYSCPSDIQGILDISVLEWWGQSNDALTFNSWRARSWPDSALACLPCVTLAVPNSKRMPEKEPNKCQWLERRLMASCWYNPLESQPLEMFMNISLEEHLYIDLSLNYQMHTKYLRENRKWKEFANFSPFLP